MNHYWGFTKLSLNGTLTDSHAALNSSLMAKLAKSAVLRLQFQIWPVAPVFCSLWELEYSLAIIIDRFTLVRVVTFDRTTALDRIASLSQAELFSHVRQPVQGWQRERQVINISPSGTGVCIRI